MDNDVSGLPDLVSAGTAPRPAAKAPGTGLPEAVSLVPAPAPALDAEKNIVFTSLVQGEGDITGLVAYSLYKQNKLDWLAAFETAKGRIPGDAELASYIIGESTARRLATYRHLAEATIAGKGPDVEGAAGVVRGSKRPAGPPVRTLLLAAYGIIAALVLLGLWVALHYTLTAR